MKRPSSVHRAVLSRRALLASIGSTAALLPFLPPLDSEVEAASPQMRLVLWFHPTGSVISRWRPTGGETNFVLSDILKPLEARRKDLLVLDGIGFEPGGPGSDHPHGHGMSKLWTASFMLPGMGKEGDVGGGAGGPSVDQVIADRIGQDSFFRSIELQVTQAGVGSGDSAGRMIHRGARAPVAPERDPWKAFDRIFAKLDPNPADDGKLTRLKRRQQSVIDLVRGELTAIESRIGSADRRKIELHLEGLRAVERRLQTNTGPATLTCEKPMLGGRLDIDAHENIPELGAMQMEILAMALRCGLTRVASLQWAAGYPNTTYPFLGITDEHHHEKSHRQPRETAHADMLVRINAWYMEQLASFMKQLADTPEGDGTMLDRTIIVSCSEISSMGDHAWDAMPFVIGGGGAVFRTGRYLRFGAGTYSNRLLVSLGHAMGLPDLETFGDTDRGRGPLSGLV